MDKHERTKSAWIEWIKMYSWIPLSIILVIIGTHNIWTLYFEEQQEDILYNIDTDTRFGYLGHGVRREDYKKLYEALING